jgi:type I restriction enzyme S subunit
MHLQSTNDDLPSGWTRTAIGRLCTLHNGRAFKPEDWEPEGLPIIRIQNLNNFRATFNHFSGKLADHHRIRSGDLLFAWSGTPGTSFGAHVWRGCDAVLNQHIFRVDFDDSVIDRDYFCHVLNFSLEAFIAQSHGGAGLAHITKGRLEETTVPLAPRKEQARIALAISEALEDVTSAEAAFGRVRDGLKQFRASILHAACIGAFSSDGLDQWKAKPLRDLISDGPKNGYSPRAGNNENGTLALKLTATSSGHLNLAPNAVKRLSETIPRGSPLYLRTGDLLFQRGNTPEYVGIAAVYDGPPDTYVYPDLMIRVRAHDPVLTSWIWRVANSPAGRRHMRNAASGTAGSMPKITADAVRSLSIPLPPHGEMRRLLGRIEEELNAADDAEALVEEQQANTATLRQSILHAAFTGRLVSQDSTDEPAAALLDRLGAMPVATRNPRARRSASQSTMIESPT